MNEDRTTGRHSMAFPDNLPESGGADFIHAKLPEGGRSWFICPNRGEPFDSAVRDAVMAEIHQD